MKTVALFLVAFIAQCAGLKIEITQGQIRPDPIAIVEFYGNSYSLNKIGADISAVIEADLERSGLFEAMNKRLFIQKQEIVAKQEPRFEDWRLIKARFLLCGAISSSDNNQDINITFRLYDVITGKKMLALEVKSNRLKWRKIAHIIADEVYKRITNEGGFFNTHIVYVQTLGYKTPKPQKLLIRMDQDGENPQKLTDGSDFSLMPSYSPNGRLLAYLRYVGKKANVHVIDISTGKKSGLDDLNKTLKNYGEMSFAPCFTTDSQGLLLSLVKDGKSAIYHCDLKNQKLSPLTEHKSIDTSPCPSPDGSKIVFTSDRDKEGGEQIYIMNKDGSNPYKISAGGGKYSQPVWSPRGDLIAFTKQRQGVFYIGLMATDGSDERLIASGYLVEAPSWSPNGRYLAYTLEERGTKKRQIIMIDLTGRNKTLINTTQDSSYCTWSPLLN